MTTKAITFDAEGTLVKVSFCPGKVTVDAVRASGLALPNEESARQRYLAEYVHRKDDIDRASLGGDQAASDKAWHELLHDWMKNEGLDTAHVDKVFEAGRQILFGPDQKVFVLYPETVECLDKLAELGLKCAIVSNWDVSLYRVLKILKIDHYFDWVGASHVEGVSKPDPAFFELALGKLGVSAGEAVHIGDRHEHDIVGAEAAGMRAILIDRSASPQAGAAGSLMEIFKRL